MHYADLLFIIHRPITEHDENAQLANVLVFGKNEAYILLLLPVPRSIMMCLFLPQRCERVIIEASKYGYAPIEEHDRARIIQLVHLCHMHNTPLISRSIACDSVKDQHTLLKSGTSVMSTR